jgi:Lrp/AsnC family leucine-responsive transcriptional regulator
MPRLSSSDSQFDRIDRRIIEELRVDGRMTITELANRVGLSKTPCQMRLRKLIEKGGIRGFRAVVDEKLLGEGHIAFAEVKLSDTRETALAEFRQGVSRIREVEECHMIAGQFDYLLKVRTSDIVAYREVLGEKISSLPHVASTSSFVAMEVIVDGGSGKSGR